MKDLKFTLAIAGIYIFRMLGLFMILPVFSLYAQQFMGSTPFLIGLTVGMYGLTQALMQIPLGWLSDHVGRKKVIAGGLIVMLMGSLIAGSAHTISQVLLGRALQGAGAIGSTLLALLSDVVPEARRPTAMAIIGLSIGVAFGLAMFLGPLLNLYIGIHGLFYVTAGLAMLGMVLLGFFLPSISVVPEQKISPALQWLEIIKNKPLWILNVSVFFQHLLLTATFIGLPLLLKDLLVLWQLPAWKLYLPALIFSFVIVFPLLRQQTLLTQPRTFYIAILLLLIAEGGLFYSYQGSYGLIVPCLFLFFIPFNFLEAVLPSRVSQVAPPYSKGMSIGIYSSLQFFGMFMGGVCGGVLYAHFGVPGIFAGNAIIVMIWLALVWRLFRL